MSRRGLLLGPVGLDLHDPRDRAPRHRRSRPTDEVTCYWVSIPGDLAEDPTIWFDFNLTPPPEGVTVVWQSWACRCSWM